MKSLFESLLRLYEFDGPAAVAPVADAKPSVEQRLPDLSAHDRSTFSYLP